MSSASPSPDGRFRLVWFIFGLIFALASAAGGCALARAEGLPWPVSLMTAAFAFACALPLALTVINFFSK